MLRGGQKAGRFDELAVLGSQAWPLNYLTGNETSVNATSLGTSVNIWEGTLLLFDHIVQQAQAFIEGTEQ